MDDKTAARINETRLAFARRQLAGYKAKRENEGKFDPGASRLFDVRFDEYTKEELLIAMHILHDIDKENYSALSGIVGIEFPS